MTMTTQAYGLSDFVADLRRVTGAESDERSIVRRIAPLARKLAATPGWIEDAHRACDPEQGFGVHLLHEDPDHANAVFLLAWLPGRGTPAHNHKTWAVVAAIEGGEREIMWRRLDDGSKAGYAELQRETETAMTASKVSCLLSDDIHTVWNEGADISLSLHVYGKHINYTERSQFDPEAKTEERYVVTVE
jgi:predicted metal-dependent enzyme (double-stranded beta helix superfamily)